MRRTAGDFSCFAIGNLPGKIFLNILDLGLIVEAVPLL